MSSIARVVDQSIVNAPMRTNGIELNIEPSTNSRKPHKSKPLREVMIVRIPDAAIFAMMLISQVGM